MSLAEALKHLYPAITNQQFSLRDDGEGPYLEWLDPALGTAPSDAELARAEAAYVAPSYLDAGEREPGLSDIESNLRESYNYFRWRVGQKVKAVASRNGMFEVVRLANGKFEEVPIMEKAAKYAQVAGSPFGNSSRAMMQWESNVWTYLQTRWVAIDPRGNFTGFDGVTPPTWPQLQNDIDKLYPEP